MPADKECLSPTRRGLLRADVPKQPLPPDVGGLPGDGGALRGLLPDLPQHSRRRAHRAGDGNAAQVLPNSQVMGALRKDGKKKKKKKKNLH